MGSGGEIRNAHIIQMRTSPEKMAIYYTERKAVLESEMENPKVVRGCGGGYNHSSTRLHGVVLIQLNTGTTL
jgi:hypothetical protein